jgi:spore coat protein U-like protein
MRQKSIAILALYFLLDGAAATAATATGSFQVSVTIQATCTITGATALNFGTAGVLGANVDQTSTITVQCTNTTPYDIGLDQGVNGSSVTAREMVGGPTSEAIQYSLYRDAARTLNWGTTIATDTVTATGNGTAQNYTVYGRIPPQTTPTPGSYTDTITVTVTY